MLELIVEAAEGFIRLRPARLDGAVAFFIVSAAAPVPSAIDLLLPGCGSRRAAHPDAEPSMGDSSPDAALLHQCRTWSKVFRGMMGGCVPTA